MLNVTSRTWLIGGWIIVPALVVTVSMSLAASLSTTVFLAALSMAAGTVIALLTRRASPTVAEILHAANAKEGRP